MKMNPVIYTELQNNNHIITTARTLELGFSKALLPKYEKAGILERVRQGVYILSDEIHDDMYTLMLRSDNIIFSHETALFLLGLSERTPFEHSVTIPTNTSLPNSLCGECKCYYIKPSLHDLGVIEKKTTFGNTVRCYDAERTLCDLIRSRNRIDEETVISAVKIYVSYKEKDLNRLAYYSEKLNVAKKIKTYLEVLL